MAALKFVLRDAVDTVERRRRVRIIRWLRYSRRSKRTAILLLSARTASRKTILQHEEGLFGFLKASFIHCVIEESFWRERRIELKWRERRLLLRDFLFSCGGKVVCFWVARVARNWNEHRGQCWNKFTGVWVDLKCDWNYSNELKCYKIEAKGIHLILGGPKLVGI